MTLVNIVVYLGLIGLVLSRKVQGRPVGDPKQLFALPVIMIVAGYGDLAAGHLAALGVAITVIGVAVSLAMGALRGRADTLSVRDGAAYVQWNRISLLLFGANIGAKLVLDLIGVAAGGTSAAAGSSLIFTLGFTLLAESCVIWLRSGSVGAPVRPAPGI